MHYRVCDDDYPRLPVAGHCANSGWLVVLRRAYWQLLNFVINTLG